MKISASVRNTILEHLARVVSDAEASNLSISAKTTGRGSEISGGELLMLALATCYCNDLFREAQRLGVAIDAVEVTASADFEGVGSGATNIRYWAEVESEAPRSAIDALLDATDQVAEVHNTVRCAVPVILDTQRSGLATVHCRSALRDA